ncbi:MULTISPECIES: phenylalanine--tRNA ligase subunit beta [Psychrilyobacter]|uniref:Phenylalanine--tRNA ligase beta subunit n=1 Tax=Psychrilyobacter piezotolerans TaxID=2293438 RepID=A0ABX9KI74_9FUSO|nr:MULTISPECIES: phenylalanine--tRNA ligase subunit beta [Psychrilyobacter]MCS5421167.1 phenylalanine--tRNA ligase subunit beta [Psychrilyobacter sp. S5]NDI77918.1 phenylalanine--tRNA ligase subunit beta [Psychrilyobacter piezotolerans]RDE62035.1 phenylalanine--tRNA ligase subunit beta [Psychrilyobacter sp. S5]REI41282.1 phenylalanine--tRNA ligase subunit beta [Psychrilyobacter piezotolerans]
MLISLEWLKEYVEINEDVKELENALTMIGQEVEAIEEQGQHLDNVVVGHIVEYGQHPDADKLSLLKVNVGEETPLQIICGAPNHKLGDKVIVAKIGAVLPGNFKIKKAKVRGVESCGMLCSEVELGMGTDGDGIVILSEDAPIGEDIRTHLGLDDVIFELEITPNRPDCLSHIGIAREVAAYYERKVKYPASDIRTLTGPSGIVVDIDDDKRCTRYSSRILKNVKVEESPEWLKRRLKAIGLRPINNIVDITNYIMFEYNQPMHAFDHSKLEGSKITVREAEKGEKITTLDGEERELNNSELVIADEAKAVAIAGIMGGKNTEVDENTTEILLEVAYFTPENIRKTAKTLGLSSDSSYRFERGIDRDNTLVVLERASSLIQSITNCEVVGEYADVYTDPYTPREVSMDINRLNKFVGKEIELDTVGKILNSLNMQIKNRGENKISVIPPSYRNDITRSADLYEEIIRMYGFENIEDKMPVENIKAGVVDEEFQTTDTSKKHLRDMGLQEVINYSFIPRGILEKLKVEAETIDIKNPINEDMVTLRPTLMYGLLTNIRDNFNRNINDLKIFEVSRTFTKAETLADEVVKVGIALAGREERNLWDAKPEAYDFYDLKGYVESYLTAMGMTKYQLRRTENKSYHPGRAVDIFVGREYIGTFGEIHPDVAEAMSISRERVYLAELELAKVVKYGKTKIKYEKIVKYPAVNRDLAILMDRDKLVGDMLGDIKKSSNIIEGVNLFDIYTGDKVEADKKSIAINIVLRKTTGTLEENEVTAAIDKILGLIKKKYQGEIRQ